MSTLSIVFAGSPAAAVPSLTALQSSRHKVKAVVTREDSRQGRRAVVTPTPVADAAESFGIPVIKANSLSGDAATGIAGIRPDLGVIVAYGGLVREPLLSTPRLGWINLHFSLLPRWRGAAPVQHSIMAGDELTGTSVFSLVRELDAGELLGQSTQAINPRQTAGELLDSLAVAGAEILLRVVDSLSDGTARGEAQQGDVTFAPKLSLDDGRIDWSAPATTIDSLIRGVTPEPGAHTTVDGNRLKVLEATPFTTDAALAPGSIAQLEGHLLVGTGTTPIELLRIVPAGKKEMRAIDWWRGRTTNTETVAL